MDQRDEAKAVFEKMSDYIGPALRIARVWNNKKREEVAEILRYAGLAHMSAYLLGHIELEEQNISFDDLEILCRACNFSLARILKTAHLLYRLKDRIDLRSRRMEPLQRLDIQDLIPADSVHDIYCELCQNGQNKNSPE